MKSKNVLKEPSLRIIVNKNGILVKKLCVELRNEGIKKILGSTSLEEVFKICDRHGKSVIFFEKQNCVDVNRLKLIFKKRFRFDSVHTVLVTMRRARKI